MEEEKMNLRLDMNVQKLETEKLRKRNDKAERDLDSLKTDYKRLRCSMKAAGLGKTSEQWCQEIQEEKIKADRWERKFQDAQMRNETLEKSLSESRNEKGELKARVAELEKILYQYRNRNSVMELRASLDKIEQMKRRVEELEMALQNCEIRIESLKASEEPKNLSAKHRYGTRAKTKDMDQRLEKLEQLQREMQDQLQAQMQERLDKFQRKMTDKIVEFQDSMMAKLTQLLTGVVIKGKAP
ncbi:uncharacterized protein LOC105795987 [Gossypium raimondii]|uniref:uncharacterized protein LOC105795987 n=1 Tax=Gossypium raimondii TaxID=29730 RepID=UPI00063AC32B|nr:uncharacterized protein LOC105795987 [Gossypium raimondii]